MMEFKERELNTAISSFVDGVKTILGEKTGMICLFGSVAYEDLSPNYGDLDFHCLLNAPLTQEEIQQLFEYRKELKASSNIYSQMLEGEFAPVTLCEGDAKESVAYWGTSREKVADKITVRSFSLMGLIKKGIVIYGCDWRDRYQYPSEEEMIADVHNMIKTVRTYAVNTNDNIHAIDWLFLISQSLYWLAKDDVTSKSEAARWAYQQSYGEWVNSIPKALELRKNPVLAESSETKAWLSSLGPTVQKACDDLQQAVTCR